MLSELHKEKAQFHYYQALTHILHGDEKETSHALLMARETVLNGRHFTDLKADDLAILAPGLTEDKFNALHGDYGYTLKSQWVPATLMPKVKEHHTFLAQQFGFIHDERGRVMSWDDYTAHQDTEASLAAAMPRAGVA